MTDLSGKTILITGASSGIGEHAALELARMGAELVLLCRNPDRGEATRRTIARETGNDRVEILVADLASLVQVREAAERFLASGRALHVLLNNAGMLSRKRVQTEDGHEAMFAVNHLACFLLTNLLRERMEASAPARIVTVASGAHRYARDGLRMDDLGSERGFSMMRVYGQSKLANILFTRELARRLAGTGVTANSLHPGVVATGLFSGHGAIPRAVGKLASLFMLPAAAGARTSVHLCASPEVEGVSGKYFIKCKEVEPGKAARDDQAARALWDVSADMVGL
jgi:NAD(P)-dependent dehydrogenase (short-subunit alcohol dehydrogenase family)